MVAYIHALDKEEHILGDIRGVVGDSFQIMGHKNQVEGRANGIFSTFRLFEQYAIYGVFELVDLVVSRQDGLSHCRVPLNKGIQTTPDHGLHQLRHARDIDTRLGWRTSLERRSPLRYVHNQISHPFQVAVDLNGSRQETEIFRDGLVQCGEADRDFIDVDIELVDAVFDVPDFIRWRLPAFHEPQQTGGDGGFHQSAHLQQPRLKVGKFRYEGPCLQGTSKIASRRRNLANPAITFVWRVIATMVPVEKTFYIETFGCQMNAHDTEKVVGTLLHEGYAQVPTAEQANYVFYNTCSIRDAAEQKVFNRLQHFKKAAGKGKVFAVIGCVAQQEGEKIFDRAPHVSLVAGSASYTRLPEMLVQLEAGNRRVTGLSLDTDQTFDTPFTSRDNPHRGWITIIEGCDKNCAYCVVPFTRGPERSRTSASVIEEATRLAGLGYTEIQLLGQNVNSYCDPSTTGWDFATLLDRVGRVPGIRRVRFTTSHPRDFVKPIIDAIESA